MKCASDVGQAVRKCFKRLPIQAIEGSDAALRIVSDTTNQLPSPCLFLSLRPFQPRPRPVGTDER